MGLPRKAWLQFSWLGRVRVGCDCVLLVSYEPYAVYGSQHREAVVRRHFLEARYARQQDVVA